MPSPSPSSPSKKQRPTHLTISGGGIKGISIIGALSVLKENDLLGELRVFLGSSVGGIIALMLVIGYTIEEIYDIMMHIDFEKYREYKFTELIDKWGFDSGETLMKLLASILKQRAIPHDINFRDLVTLTGKELILTGSELTTSKEKFFNHIDTPEMKILDAIRITISFPFVYFPIRTENEITKTGELYIDGGLLEPYPINYFKDVPRARKIGILIHNKWTKNKIETYEDFILSILFASMEKYEKLFLRGHRHETIVINIPEINSMNFNITGEMKMLMFQSGEKSAIKYLLARNKGKE